MPPDSGPIASAAVPPVPAPPSSWENEGGAQAAPSAPESAGAEMETLGAPNLAEAALVQLRVRVVALENLVISMLAEGTSRQLELAREMAAYICPRPGFTDHPLTTRAAVQMNHLVERAAHFRSLTPS